MLIGVTGKEIVDVWCSTRKLLMNFQNDASKLTRNVSQQGFSQKHFDYWECGPEIRKCVDTVGTEGKI